MDFDIPIIDFYPDYASSYYDDHPGNTLYNNDGCPFTIADAIIDGAIDYNTLAEISTRVSNYKE
ncbi:hypothetical protein IKD82_01115 [Candidatus Saccharibacteria bacterium]|nr:hypothetical protein [Candidatus Saccharibacteria bacterium]